jgi:hypothetical protein
MHSVTVKISVEGRIIGTSIECLASWLHGISRGAVSGSVEVIEGPIEVVEPSAAIRKRLMAVLDVRPKTIVPILSERIVAACAGILPDMSPDQIERTRAALAECNNIAIEYGRDDIAVEIQCISNSLEECYAG